MTFVRDRIRELRRVPASQLRAHPRNWREHPQRQRQLMQGVLAEIGYADALLVRELGDGSYELIDGHLRAESTPDMDVPVLILDLSAAEADKLLALHDPLAALAETNGQMLSELLQHTQAEDEAIQAMFAELQHDAQRAIHRLTAQEQDEIDLKPLFQVVVECVDEVQQKSVYDQLKNQNLHVRVLTM